MFPVQTLFRQILKIFKTSAAVMISDLLFQIYSAQLQTLLLLEHRGYPCHPPDKKRPLQVKVKKCQTPNFQLQYFHKCNRNFPIVKKVIINTCKNKRNTYVCIVWVCAYASPHFQPSKKKKKSWGHPHPESWNVVSSFVVVSAGCSSFN